MEKELYKKLMLETADGISKIILSYLAPLKKEHPKLYALCAELPIKKLGTFETRAYLMRFSFEACINKKWTKETKHACAAVELELASMYYANRIFDDKGGKKILSKPNNQFIAAMITRDLASQALANACRKLSYKEFIKVKDLFDEINKIFYIGQYYEIENNIYANQKKFNFDRLLKLYYKRDYGVNNSFFEKIAIIGAILGGGNQKQIKALAEFGKNYGMALQIINDIGDFVPPKYNLGTEEKLSEDAYSDIKHGKLTLPIIFALKKEKGKNKQLLIKALTGKATDKELLAITEMVVNDGAINIAQEFARKFIHESKKSSFIFNEKHRTILEGICFIAYSNRYYKTLTKFKKPNN